VRVSLQFLALGSTEEETSALLPAYFPPRAGCRLTLYQDADTPLLPCFQGVECPDGSPYTPPRLWRDLYDSIQAAQKFLYIAGWSVDTKVSLLRGEEDPDCSISRIGDLLVMKAEEGVRVLLLIWNDASSADWLGAGQMGTHDEETEEFFAGTKVVVANVGRGWGGMVYTHHQKTVVMDQGGAVVSYLGGIDLTDGRFDNPTYPLFDYSLEHAQDFYQNCSPGSSAASGPREPWHDIHARLEGPAARDVLANFQDRWRKQAADKEAFLYPVLEEFGEENPLEEVEGEVWVAQVLRSINSDSCTFPSEDRLPTLHRKRGLLVDDSILRAYITQIRRAQRFIHIENQYFLGSSYAWSCEQDTRSKHTVPREIVTKVISKMEAGEEFMVYVVIPMFPEGDPTSMASQEILYWQYRTMEAMYTRIGGAISSLGLPTRPTDYLLFLCPGKQECPGEVPADLAMPEEGTPAALARRTLRHPVYVHSKMMVVDDEHVIVGTANINQRSMDGGRDSEIAVTGHQPGQARGQVHTFRMSLFAAHLGGHDEVYKEPASRECVERVREVVEEHQAVYRREEPPEEHTSTHLLPYPVQVGVEGQVEVLPGWETFPDTQAPVLGERSGMLPGNLTT